MTDEELVNLMKGRPRMPYKLQPGEKLPRRSFWAIEGEDTYLGNGATKVKMKLDLGDVPAHYVLHHRSGDGRVTTVVPLEVYR